MGLAGRQLLINIPATIQTMSRAISQSEVRPIRGRKWSGPLDMKIVTVTSFAFSPYFYLFELL